LLKASLRPRRLGRGLFIFCLQISPPEAPLAQSESRLLMDAIPLAELLRSG
jgi:hypothetical protein